MSGPFGEVALELRRRSSAPFSLGDDDGNRWRGNIACQSTWNRFVKISVSTKAVATIRGDFDRLSIVYEICNVRLGASRQIAINFVRRSDEGADHEEPSNDKGPWR